MASINALSVALFNAAAGGYAAEMAANSAGFANAVGPILEKNISTDALFVEHLLANLGVLPTNSVYEQAKAAVTGLVTAKGRAGAAIDAIDFLKAQEGGTSPYAVIAATFAAKVNQATLFTAANSTERDITKLISGVTGVDTDVAATNVAVAAAVAAQKATDDAAAAKAAADAAAVLKAAQDKAAADLSAANTAAAAAAKAAADAATAAAVKAAADAATAAATLKAAQDAAAAAATAAAEKAELEKAAAVAAVDKTTDNAAAVTTALKAAASAAGVTGYESMTDSQLIAAIKTSNDSAITAAVDKTTDNAAAVTAALKAAALDLGVTGTSAMTDAELITAIKTVNDTAIAAAATAAAEAVAATAAAAALAAVNDTTYASESAAYTAGQAAGAAGLTYNGVTYASIAAYIAATTPAAPTSSTVTAAQIVTSNAVAGNNAMVINAADAGSYAVTLNTDVVTSDGGFIISGNANLTVTSGAQADTISVVGDGNNSITTGAGSDTVTVVGTGTNTINVGAGSDVVTGGTGNDTITFGSGQLGAGDVVTGGDGTDTVVISGDGNIIGGAGATLTGVENLVLNGTTVTITKAALEALDSVSGHATTSEVTVDVASGNTLDLSGTTLTGLKSITADDNVTIVLSASQIQEVGSITTAAGKNLTISTDVAGLLALGSKAAAGTGGTLAKTISDTLENIQANSAAIAAAGVTPSLSGAVTVAQAKAALAVTPTVTFALSDTAANLALAPVAVFNNSSTIAATTAATAAQATAINAILTAATGFAYAANKVTVNVTDTASNIANYYVEATAGDDFDAVTSSGNSTAAEAIAAYALNATAAYSVIDTAANLVTNKAQAALDHASSITASDAATVDQISQVNAASDVDVSSGYALTDTLANLTAGGAATIVASAGNVIVSDATLSVANAMIAETLTNTGTTRYVVEDAIGTLLAANSDVVASTTTVSTSTADITASQANALVAKFSSAKVSDANLVINDTVEELLTLTAAAVAEAKALNGITISSGTATVAQVVALNTLVGTKLDKSTVAVSDSAANLVAGVGVTSTLTLLNAVQSASGTIAVSSPTTVSNIVTINTALTSELNSFGLDDSASALLAATGGEALNAVQDAASIAVNTATSMANVDLIKTAAASGTAPTLTYSIRDTAANIIADAASLRAGATTLSITDASVTGDQTVALKGYTNFDGVYAVNDTYDEILGAGKNVGLTTAYLNAATSVTITDTVAHLEAAGVLTAIATATTDDALVVSDTLSNLNTSRTSGTAVAAATSIVITDTDLDVGDVTTVNALRALKATTYTVSDAYSDLATAIAATGSGGANETGAVTTFLNNAGTVKVDANADGTLDAITVAQYNTLDAATTSAIRSDITDTIANLTASSGAAALSNVIANGNTLTISDTNATVAQIQTLNTAGATVTALNAVDTAANLTAMNSTLLASLNGATVSDNGSVTQNVAALTKIYSNDGSQYANYSIVDTAENIANAITANAGLVNFATAVTATTNATYTQAGSFASATTFGTPIVYSVTVAAADNIAAGSTLNSAVNITASDAQSVADARILNEATNSGSTSYAVSDAASAFVNGTPATQALISAAVEAATGTVTASTAATLAEAAVIGGLTKSVTYSISDTAANVANATTAGINEAVNIAITTALTAAQAATFLSATNSGTTTLTAVTDTAANALGLTLGANDVITTLTVTGAVSAVNAAAIAAKDTGANITNTVVFSGTISGSSTEIATIPDAVLAAATTVNVTGAMTVAQYNALAAAITIGNVDSYALSDSFSNLMVNSDVAGAVNANAAIAGATTVTVTDTALTIAQADAIDGLNVGDVVYDIRDTDAKIVAALNGNGSTEDALLAAANVYSADGVLLDIQTVGAAGTTNVISGTKVEIDALSSVLKATQVAYEVSVADLEANPSFYSNLAANQHLTVIDTVANLTSGNALVPAAEHIVVNNAATVAQATSIRALSSLDDTPVYNLQDTAANLVAGAVLNGAVNVTATNAATQAQAEVIADATNSGTVTYDVSAIDTTVTAAAGGALAATNAYENARNITITGTTGIDAAQAAILLAKANSGSTTIAKVTGTSADLADLSVGSNDVITTVTPSDAATVAQAVAMLARAGSISAYSLSDTAANLAAASSSILNGATNIALSSGDATVAQATIIDAATNSGTTTMTIVDTAAAVLGASATVLANDATVLINDTTVSAGVATQLRALDSANTGFTIAKGVAAAGVFPISDSQANIVAAANAAAVAASTDVRVTGTLTVAQGVAVKAAATSDANPTYSLTDTYTNLVINRSGANALTLTSVDVTVSNSVNVAQANVIDGYSAHSVTQNIVDTAANVATAAAANDTTVNAANSVTLSGAATVAQAATIEQKVAHLSGGYAITDTAAAVFSALNTANGAAGTADNGLLDGATAITLNSAATVAQALGGAANSGSDAEARGLYTISGLSYAITDTVTNIIAGLAQTNDASGITGATALNASDTTAMTVANAATLTSLTNFKGYDHDSSALTAGRYYITDGFANIQAADTALISGATTVVANGTTGANIIDLSMHANGITINGGTNADTITGTASADTFVQGISDSVASSASTFAAGTVAASDIITFGGGVDVINGFVAGAGGDVLDVLVSGEPTTLIGETVTNLTAGQEVFFVSGVYDASTGVFTIAANGTGADTAIIQADNSVAASDALTTNASIVVLVGVDSDNLVAGNFI
jgi:hypothetical protein